MPTLRPHPGIGRPVPCRIGMLSTYPPKLCGLATFAAALSTHLHQAGHRVDVVRVDDGDHRGEPSASRLPAGRVPVAGVLLNGSAASVRSAAAVLSQADVAIIQHEYGIFGGPDGDEVLDLIDALTVPVVVVLHTVPLHPTERQRSVLEDICARAQRVVVMSRTAHDRLLSLYAVEADKVADIPHGAALPRPEMDPPLIGLPRPELLTWGLLGPGKGIEHVIDALGLLSDLPRRPRYTVAGVTHPKVFARDGDLYRHSLVRRSWTNGVADTVTFDDTYRDVAQLTRFVASATLVVLPYDSVDQVTSGVLVDAIAAGKPVIATAFPHATEMLATGAGIVVPHRDPAALAAALRSVLTAPDRLAAMTAEARRLAPGLGWSAIAGRYSELCSGLVDHREAVALVTAAETFSLDHLDRMSDHRGLFEHAEGIEPREEHGYCTDDNARLLVVTAHEPDTGAAHRLFARLALQFVCNAQDSEGRSRNRMDSAGRWLDEAGTDDCWGRGLWGLGVAAAHHSNPTLRRWAMRGFDRGARQRSQYTRAMAFAAIGAAEVVSVDRTNKGARRLVEALLDMVGQVPAGDWAWPEPRLRYANAALAEAVIASGAALHRVAAIERGLAMLGWLLDIETHEGHLSVTGVGGRGPGDASPQFDQQPIEVAALADACARALTVSDDARWPAGIEMAAAWFVGDNDRGAQMFDPESGGGYDGLMIGGVNLNQGAESSLAFLATMQRARAFERAS